MARKNYSRLAKTEAKRARKSALVYIVLTIVLIVLLPTYGLTALSKFTGFLYKLSGRDNTTITKSSDGNIVIPPRIDTLPQFTNQDKVRISGTTTPGMNVEVFFDDSQKEVLADANGEFSASFTISEERDYTGYAFTVNNAGEKSEKSQMVKITYDKTPPNLEIISPANETTFYGSQQSSQRIQGQVEEDDKVLINDRIAIVDGSGKFDYMADLAKGDNNFKIKVSDQAGNETEQDLKLTLVY